MVITLTRLLSESESGEGLAVRDSPLIRHDRHCSKERGQLQEELGIRQTCPRNARGSHAKGSMGESAGTSRCAGVVSVFSVRTEMSQTGR